MNTYYLTLLSEIRYVIPEFFLGISIIYLLLFGAIVSTSKTYPLIQRPILKLSILILIFTVCLIYSNEEHCIGFREHILNNTMVGDYLGFASKLIISVFSLLCLIMIKYYLIDQQINQFEYLIVILVGILGLFILCSSNDFMTAFLALEVQSLAFYIMSAFKKNSSFSVEAGLKYFILGSFSSALFLLGASLIYGATGTFDFDNFRIISFVVYSDEFKYLFDNYSFFFELDALHLGLSLILISLFFKLAVAPLHVWSPDIYENSPTSSTIFFAVVSKLGILVLLIRLFLYSFYGVFYAWRYYIVGFAVISVIIGAITALEQKKMKSLLAYSSISHIGYILIAFSVGTINGLQNLYAYIMIYTLAGFCIWSIFLILRMKAFYFKKQNKDLSDLTLLFKSHPIIAVGFSIVLLSIAGLPPFIGFLTKIGIFSTAIESSMYFVAIISILASVISTFYYIRIIKILFFEKVLVGNLYHPLDYSQTFLVITSCFLFIYLFIDPSILYYISYLISGFNT